MTHLHTSDKDRWNARYAHTDSTATAADVLAANLYLLPAQGDALDLACGLGGNALLLARHGLTAQAWDISRVGLSRLSQQAVAEGLTIQVEERDVVAQPPSPDSFDVIVVSYFLDRSLMPTLQRAVRPGGLLFYQTFTETRLTGRGPDNPDYRLKAQELFNYFKELQILFYRENFDQGDISQGLRDEAELIARRPA
jgi:SAM-dependent methyltransferase